MTTRRPLSRMRKLALFEKVGGICHICGLKIQGKWEVEHVIPLALGGADEERNMAPAHQHCHAPKTAADVASIAKAKRQKANHIGIKKPSSFPKTPPGSRWDWKMGRRVFDKETT